MAHTDLSRRFTTESNGQRHSGVDELGDHFWRPTDAASLRRTFAELDRTSAERDGGGQAAAAAAKRQRRAAPSWCEQLEGLSDDAKQVSYVSITTVRMNTLYVRVNQTKTSHFTMCIYISMYICRGEHTRFPSFTRP